MRNLLRYYHTLKYLKPAQIYGQIKIRLHKPKTRLLTAPATNKPEFYWIDPIIKNSAVTAPNELAFLNQTRDISATTIWSDASIDKLWLYNLHYFDVINAETDSQWQQQLIKRWIRENPAGTGNGWEPYPLSLRIVNWIKWILAGNNADNEILDSLATQANHLSKRMEIHIQGNHLLANAKALLFAGLLFQGSRAQRWLRKGFNTLRREISRHVELSPMYHAIILEDLLDSINMLQAYGKNIPIAWLTSCNEMLHWLKTLTHPDNEIAFFNDATLGIAPTLMELNAYHQRLNLQSFDRSLTGLTHLTASGYVRAEIAHAVLLTDIAAVGAPYQPGHAHADTLSFEFSLNQHRLFINSGISTYAVNAQRENQRSTCAHNTVTIDELNSSHVWKSFRVAQRARVRDKTVTETPTGIIIQASHDGYYKSHKIIHTRLWELTSNTLLIQDELSGDNQHTIRIFFHLHPGITLGKHDMFNFELINKEKVCFATMTTSHACHVADSTYHPGFNISLPNKKLVIETVTALPARFKTFIQWK
jgi:uncharacterized heparinase superfamily protein